MPTPDPILDAAKGTMRQLLTAQAAPVSRLLAEVGISFDLDTAQRADLADVFASELHAEHIQNRLAAERATPPAHRALGRTLKTLAALSFALATLTILTTLAATRTLSTSRLSLVDPLHPGTSESIDVRP
jgi:hypothetical protein